ncbi:hypothetical protein FQA39_LY03158 [Lamprigera yunnana]|nr:hypothetical protein FQA39_LY03158 [Lamprigera yunnana]
MIITTLICITFFLLCLRMRKAHRYWKQRNTLHIKPWPFFGFVAPTLIRYKAFPWVLQDAYNVFPEQRCFGLYQFLTPYLVIRSPDLINRITVEDFDTFPNHKSVIDSDSDPIYDKILFCMKAEEKWKDLRSVLVNTIFGNELKRMFELIQSCSKNYVRYLLEQKDNSAIELKGLTTKFANDVIATTVYGVSCNSLEADEKSFYTMSKFVTDFNLLRTIKFFLYGLSPRIMKFFKFSLIESRTRDFYLSLLKDDNSTKPNLMHYLQLNQLPNEDQKRKLEINEEDVLAQSIQFLYFGYKTVSTALMFLMHELSLHQEIQAKLADEIRECCPKNEVGITYQSLIEMEYLDMVVAESLRKWPPTITTDRKSNRTFTIVAKELWEETTEFDGGTLCLIPIFAIHRDPKYFTNPDQFDPERFNGENRKSIKPNTYLPFGVGPRNCIGSQYAIIEMKTFIFYLLRNFEVVKVNRTQDTISLSKTVFQLVPNGNVWVGLKRRTNQHI